MDSFVTINKIRIFQNNKSREIPAEYHMQRHRNPQLINISLSLTLWNNCEIKLNTVSAPVDPTCFTTANTAGIEYPDFEPAEPKISGLYDLSNGDMLPEGWAYVIDET